MRAIRIFVVTNTISIAILAFCLYELHNESRGTAFVDIGKMLNEYQFRKDLENEGKDKLAKIKSTVDSLMFIKQTKALSPAKIDTQLASAQYAFNEYYVQMNEETSKKVWDRLNPEIMRYGKDRGMKIIIGANGAGNILYGHEQRDITSDLIIYLNESYRKGH